MTSIHMFSFMSYNSGVNGVILLIISNQYHDYSLSCTPLIPIIFIIISAVIVIIIVVTFATIVIVT